MILSHRWINPAEVDYEEMVDFTTMDREDRNEIHRRLGYKKILDNSELAKRDGYMRLWVDIQGSQCIVHFAQATQGRLCNLLHTLL